MAEAHGPEGLRDNATTRAPPALTNTIKRTLLSHSVAARICIVTVHAQLTTATDARMRAHHQAAMQHTACSTPRPPQLPKSPLSLTLRISGARRV